MKRSPERRSWPRRAGWLAAIVLVPAAVAVPLAHAYVPADGEDTGPAPAAQIVLQAPPDAPAPVEGLATGVATGAASAVATGAGGAAADQADISTQSADGQGGQQATSTPVPAPDAPAPADVRPPDQLDASRREAAQACEATSPPEWCPKPGDPSAVPGKGGQAQQAQQAQQGPPDSQAQRDLDAAKANLDAARAQRQAEVTAVIDQAIAQAYAGPAQTPQRDRINQGIAGSEGNIAKANADIGSLRQRVDALQAQAEVLDGDARQAKLVELALARADLAAARAAKAQGGADKANGRTSGLVIDDHMRDQAVLTAALASNPQLDTADQAVDTARHKVRQAATDVAWYDASRAVLGTVLPDAVVGWALERAWVPWRAVGRAAVMTIQGADELGLLGP